MTARTAVDVSKLPTFAFGARDPLWWGVLGIMLIEGTMFAMCIAAYLYIRGGFDVFPPTPIDVKTFAWAMGGLGCAALSAPPIVLSMSAAKRADAAAQRKWLLLAFVPSVAYGVMRAFELASMPLRWDSHAHGSIVWFMLVMHTLHVITGCCEDLALFAVLTTGPLEKKHLVDVHTNGFYWLFVVLSGAVVSSVIYLDPAILRVLR